MDISTPFVESIWHIVMAQEAGYSLGSYQDAPAVEVDAVLTLRAARKEIELFEKQEALKALQTNDGNG